MNKAALAGSSLLSTLTCAAAIGGALFLSTSCGSSSQTLTAPSGDKCTLQAQAESLAFPPAGGSATVRVATNRECTWTARSEAGWLSLAAPAGGQGEGAVQFTVAANVDPSARSGNIGINDQRLQISQEGSPCEHRLSSSHESIGASGGERTLQVSSSSAQCRWTAVPDAPWITIVAGGEGSGSGDVTFRVDATGDLPRTGTIAIAGQTLHVEQATGCTYTIGTDTFNLGAAAGSHHVPVATAAGCGWTARSEVSWITITSGAAGSGPGAVGFQVAATDGPGRTGTLTVAGRVVTVAQSSGCGLGIEPSSFAAPASGGTGTTAVRAPAGCAWSAASAFEWITITGGQSGHGPGDVRFTVAPASGPARTGTVRIGDQTLTVTQGSGCTFTVNPSSVSSGAQGSAGTIQVTGPAACAWSAASGAAWITISGGASGQGNGQVQYAVAANAGPARQGSLTIAGRTVTISQASGCTFGITPQVQDVPGTGGTGTVSVATAAGCGWTATSHVSWMTVSPSSAAGPGQVQFTAAPNPGPRRTGTLTIAGRTFTVDQASPCSWMFAPPSHELDANGGGGTVLVIVTGGQCTWTASSTADWITITAGATGAGNGFVQFLVAPNTGPQRTGTLTIAGESYLVTQRSR